MTDPSGDSFDALRLPSAPVPPRPEVVADLRVRVHRRLGIDAPAGYQPMQKSVGLEYETAGNQGGEAVLFMHAGTATAFVSLMAEPVLADGYRLVRYHRRGYAGSDPFDGEVSVGRHVDDAIALLDHLGIERAHVVGHSGSGVLAIQLALEAPGRVRSLVLEEPALHGIDPRWRAVMSEAIALPLERYRTGDARGAMEMWMAGVSPNWRSNLTRTVPGGPQQTLEDAAAFMADVGPVEAWPFDPARVARISMPVLYVVGAESQLFHRTVLRRFQEIVPETESAVIQDAGHMLHTDQPELVASEFAAFFGRHSERR